MDAQGDVAGEHDTHVPLPDRESAPQFGLRQGTEDHGDEHRCHRERLGASLLAQNAGKRSLTLNLKSAEGRRVMRRLIGDADVPVENFRPGVMDRLGFGWDELRDINPGPVYCAVSGFGADGPLSDRPAYDQIIQGLSGMLDATGTEERAPCERASPSPTSWAESPRRSPSAAPSPIANAPAGPHLDVSTLETAITALGRGASNHLSVGVEPTRIGNENATAAPSGTFSTAEGMLNIAANKQEQYEILCPRIGAPHSSTTPASPHVIAARPTAPSCAR